MKGDYASKLVFKGFTQEQYDSYPIKPIGMPPWYKEKFDFYQKNFCGTIPTEVIANPYNDGQQWYYIPGFNGYEVSNYLVIRSFKRYKKYKFGNIPHLNSNCVYEISNSNNTILDIDGYGAYDLAMHYIMEHGQAYGYPRPTCTGPIASPTNNRSFIDFEKAYQTEKAKRKPTLPKQGMTHYAKFTVSQEDTPELAKELPCIKPIYFINQKQEEDPFYGIYNKKS